MVARFVHTEEVTGSNPVSPTLPDASLAPASTAPNAPRQAGYAEEMTTTPAEPVDNPQPDDPDVIPSLDPQPQPDSDPGPEPEPGQR